MAEYSWTKEENNEFKKAMKAFSPRSSTWYDSIAKHVGKPVAVVKVHYNELVNDLLNAMAGVLTEAKKPKWTKETHEWFLIGLNRHGHNWERIAILLHSINPREVKAYAYKFYLWQNSGKKMMKKLIANDPTLKETNVEVKVIRRPRANNVTLMDTNVNSMGRQQSFVHPQAQPQQAPIGRPARHHAEAFGSQQYYYYC